MMPSDSKFTRLDNETRLAGAHGIHATMFRYEGERIEGDAAKKLLVRLANQPDEQAGDA